MANTDFESLMRSLSDQHRIALVWFHDRAGQEISWPQPLDNGFFLMNKAKGIHKPVGWSHALSIRQSLGGPYSDRDVDILPDGTWRYEYFQEGQDPQKRDADYTNRALLRNLADGIPVAVVRQVKQKPGSRYKVLGLALVEDWIDGYFRLRSLVTSGPEEERDSAIAASNIGASLESLPLDFADARKRIERSIVARQGAGAFRANALRAFGGRCAITQFDVPEVLEAAHIVPYLGPDTNRLSNTLLLRADLHTLFDRDLLTIDPDTLKVKLDPSLDATAYSELDGVSIMLPGSDRRPWKGAFLSRKNRSPSVKSKATSVEPAKK